jgi:hypothetical protein
MEERKQQFYGFVIILLIIGFLNYFRRINAGMKLSKSGKIIHILTMIVFVVGTMFVLYYTELNNILSFCIGLFMANFSEHIAKMIVVLGDNFNIIFAKFFKKYTGVDISKELTNTSEKDSDKSNK